VTDGIPRMRRCTKSSSASPAGRSGDRQSFRVRFACRLVADHGVLGQHGAPATVSSSGRAVERLPLLARDAMRRGHEVPAHGWRWKATPISMRPRARPYRAHRGGDNRRDPAATARNHSGQRNNTPHDAGSRFAFLAGSGGFGIIRRQAIRFPSPHRQVGDPLEEHCQE